MFQSSKKQLAPPSAYSLLLDDLEKARYDLSLAYDNFQNAMDPDMIDCCIYQVNALQMRYKFLLTRAKQLEPEENIITEGKLSLQKI
ncbi:YaaL family protein [Roseburia sp. 499]|uniref:YaaL family protein n=1 Tax=Roseburia sp. 499 TaxID=1261634 RepID=UPI000950C6D1|nr:YaaL family protein [Roseburia sp. 499]WVK69844.1 YaaL family protein [Roseburia sp. 499]